MVISGTEAQPLRTEMKCSLQSEEIKKKKAAVLCFAKVLKTMSLKARKSKCKQKQSNLLCTQEIKQLCSDLTETTNAKITIFVVTELPELKTVFLQKKGKERKKEGEKERKKEEEEHNQPLQQGSVFPLLPQKTGPKGEEERAQEGILVLLAHLDTFICLLSSVHSHF